MNGEKKILWELWRRIWLCLLRVRIHAFQVCGNFKTEWYGLIDGSACFIQCLCACVWMRIRLYVDLRRMRIHPIHSLNGRYSLALCKCAHLCKMSCDMKMYAWHNELWDSSMLELWPNRTPLRWKKNEQKVAQRHRLMVNLCSQDLLLTRGSKKFKSNNHNFHLNSNQ